MRTTLAIDDDVLIAAKAIAKQQNRSVGEVASDLARRALLRTGPNQSADLLQGSRRFPCYTPAKR